MLKTSRVLQRFLAKSCRSGQILPKIGLGQKSGQNFWNLRRPGAIRTKTWNLCPDESALFGIRPPLPLPGVLQKSKSFLKAPTRIDRSTSFYCCHCCANMRSAASLLSTPFTSNVWQAQIHCIHLTSHLVAHQDIFPLGSRRNSQMPWAYLIVQPEAGRYGNHAIEKLSSYERKSVQVKGNLRKGIHLRRCVRSPQKQGL